MARVRIKITERHTADRKLENYYTRVCVGEWEFWRDYKTLRKLAADVLYDVIEGGIDPDYRITLWEGYHTPRKCRDRCGHYRYTQKPEEKTRDRLKVLLEDKKLVAEVKKQVEWRKKHPIKIVMHYD